MKIVFIFGNSAAGKMTVGQELMKITDLRLFHNHMLLEPVLEIFGGLPPRKNDIMHRLRMVILEVFAATDNYGLIVTGMVSLGRPDWQALLAPILEVFEPCGAEVYYVELEASLEVRLQRNVTENRLSHKASKRDIATSEQRLHNDDKNYVGSIDGQIDMENYIKINNTHLAADAVAKMIKERFLL